MKTAFSSLIVVVLLAMTSCGYESKQYKALKAQTDSIIAEHENLQAELEEYIVVLTGMNQGMEDVMSGKADSISFTGAGLGKNENDLLNAHIDKINALIKTSRKEVDGLKAQLRRSVFQMKKMESDVAYYAYLLEVTKQEMAWMEAQIQEKDAEIEALTDSMLVLTGELETALDEIKQQTDIITLQDNELHKAYYIIASVSDLKKNDIYNKCKHSLFEEDFNRDLFTEIDIRQVTEIEIPASAKGDILTYHLKSTYEIVKTGKTKTLYITNPQLFWSISKYLVIR